MLVYVMRHGEALPVGGAIQEDTLRPLSLLGKEQVRHVAEGLKRRSGLPSRVLSSPLLRAHETAVIVSDVLGVSEVDTSPFLAPHASPAGLRSLLAARDGDPALLLIGHHPDVTLWVAFLAGLDVSVCPFFGTASVAALQFEPEEKKAEFLWFQTSDQLSQR